ncbi:MAG: hypothetical protein FJW38_17960 [Acidobacteria bacterium]|nr:hypothetical protein [Acidobacteriota bacterium]
MAAELVVHALKGEPIRTIEDQTAITVVVGEQRRLYLAVDGKSLDVPNPIQRRLWRAAAVLKPA